MNRPPPSRAADRLWRRLADAQDLALQRGAPMPLRPMPARRGRARRLGALVLLVSGVAAAATVLITHRLAAPTPPPHRLAVTDEAGRTLVADARSDLPLQFSDGSAVTFRAGSTGRMQRLGDVGAEVFLDRGRLEAHVVHTSRTRWMVHAGPYQVRVTGTRFAVSWGATGRFEVALFEGSVVIDGAELGAGVPLRAGQRLTVDRGVVRTDVLAFSTPPAGSEAMPKSVSRAPAGDLLTDPAATATATEIGLPVSGSQSQSQKSAESESADGAGAAVGASAGVKSRAAAGGDWFSLAKQSAYDESFAAAMRVGWKGLCRRLDAHRLLRLGDVARYVGVRVRARQAFEALVTRFPRNPLAADAVFSLGRLAFEADQSERAARWFRRYVDDWPQGPLAEQAAGRLIECAVRMHDGDAARVAARAYLVRAPAGPHARLARQVLAAGAGATASASLGVMR